MSHFPRQTVRIRTVCRGKCQNLQARFDATCDDPAKPSQLGAPALCSLPCRLFDLTNLVESARALLSAGALLCPYGLPTVGGPRSYRLGSQPLRSPLCGNVPVTLPRQTGYDGVFKCTCRVTSLIKTRTSLGPNRRPMPKVRGGRACDSPARPWQLGAPAFRSLPCVPPALGLRVQSLGFGVWGLGFGV